MHLPFFLSFILSVLSLQAGLSPGMPGFAAVQAQLQRTTHRVGLLASIAAADWLYWSYLPLQVSWSHIAVPPSPALGKGVFVCGRTLHAQLGVLQLITMVGQ